MQELDQMLALHKKGEEALKRENATLKLKLEKALNSIEDSAAKNEEVKIRYEQDLVSKENLH